MSESVKIFSLSKLCDEFADGNWVQTKDQSPSGIRLVQTGNIGNGAFKNRPSKARFISEETFREMRCTEVYPGDCLVSRLPDPVGRACIIPELGERMITAVDCSILRLDRSRILPEYFSYYAQSASYFNEVERYCTGATRKRISRKNLGKVGVPVPPLSNQKRIVALLDEAFADIETAITNTEQNLANARELFETELEGVVRRAVEDQGSATLSDLATEITDGDHMPPPKSEEGLPFITIRNIEKRNRVIDFSDTFKVPEEYYDSLKPNRRPLNGDVLYTVTGSFGIPVRVDTDRRFCFQRHIALIRPKADVRSQWLEYMLLSRFVRDQAESGATGTAQKTVSLRLLRSLQIPNQNSAEQREVIARLDSLQEQTQRLISIYTTKKARLLELKQSLLQKAFSGELTADHAEREVESAAV